VAIPTTELHPASAALVHMYLLPITAAPLQTHCILTYVLLLITCTQPQS